MLNYKPGGQTLKAFMKDRSFFRGLRGPVGSGKSAGNCITILMHALEQKPGPDGIRRSPWAVALGYCPKLLSAVANHKAFTDPP